MLPYCAGPHKRLLMAGLTSAILTVVLVASQPPISRASFSSSSSAATEPLCHFPDFLQTRKARTHWMINQSNSRTSFDVIEGRIFARSGTCGKSGGKTQHGQGSECTQSNYTWVCREQKAEKKYLVRHLESTFNMHACVEFLQRNVSVVQLRMSHLEESNQSLCDDQNMFIDPWPWISYEHFRSPSVACPIAGGFNLLLKYASPTGLQRPALSRYHSGLYSSPLLASSAASEPYSCADASTAPMRLESDCVKGEGLFFDFRHESCLPPASRLMVHQRALCMASWRQENEDFAVLRSANNDRAIWCLRVSRQNDQVHEIVLFLDWVCPTSSNMEFSRRFSSKHSPAGLHLTPHLAFDVRGRQVITEPCSDQLSTCHAHAGFCSGLQCMSTCGKCSPASDRSGDASSREPDEGSSPAGKAKKATIVLTNSREAVHFPQQVNVPDGDVYSAGSHSDDTNNDNDDENVDDEDSGTNAEEEVDESEDPDVDVVAQNQPSRTFQRGCTFPENVRGTWLHRTTEGEERLEITETTLRHPRLGELHCITFLSPHSELVSLRRVLWRRYDNGCYPRFTCLHFSTPSRSVMRYRLANEQYWPLELSDEAICDERHFLESPDIFHPADKYVSRSWEVARRAGSVHKMACILPHHVPRVVSFLDDQDRSGCMVHGTYYSPRTIVLTYFPKTEREGDTTPSPPRSPGFGQTPPDNADFANTQGHEFRETSSKNARPGRPGNDFKHTSSEDGQSRTLGNDFKDTLFKIDNSGADGNDFKETPLRNDHSRTDGFFVERNDSRDKSTSLGSAVPEESHFDHDYRQLSIDEESDEKDLLEAARESKTLAAQQGEVSSARNRHSSRQGNYPTAARNAPNRETPTRQTSGYSREAQSSSRQTLGLSRQTPGSSREAAGSNRQTAGSRKNISNPGTNVRGGLRSSDDRQGSFVFRKYEYSYSNTDRPMEARYYLKSGATEDSKIHLSNDRAGNRRAAVTHDGIYANDDSNVYDGRGPGAAQSPVFQRTAGPAKLKVVSDSAVTYKTHRQGAPSASAEDDVRHQGARQRREASGADNVLHTSYECLAVMTYADTYKSVLTVTSDKPDEILCWLVVNQYTVVILNTSSCNSQTAERVLNPARYPGYKLHKHAILRLYSGERDCEAIRPSDRVWPEPVKYQDSNGKSAGCPPAHGWLPLPVVVVSLSVVSVLLQL